MIFVGCVLAHGSHMDPHGTIVIDMMRMKQRLLEMLRKNYDLHWQGKHRNLFQLDIIRFL